MASLAPMTGTLGTRLAAHLLRRSTYFVNKARIDQFAAMTPSQAVDTLFTQAPLIISEPLDPETGLPWINSGVESYSDAHDLLQAIGGWWIHEAIYDPSIVSKITFFLHANFVISTEEFYPSRPFFDYLALLRFYAKGSFKTIARKITLDNVMLSYLNGDSNTNTNPNENYAREFLELFTIGKGPQIGPDDYTNYTEMDVAAAAKLLSGFKISDRPLPADPGSIDPDTGITTGWAAYDDHDSTDKQFSNAFGNLVITGAVDEEDMYRELDDFVDMVFDQDDTARTICRKLYRYFVSSSIDTEIETDIIEPLAQTMRTNDYNLEMTLKQLLKSQHFYDADDSSNTDEIIGALLKSPLELLAHTVNFFNINILPPQANSYEHYYEWYHISVIDDILDKSGMKIFRPLNVAGYPAYYQEPLYHRNWLDASTIIARYSLGEMLVTGMRVLSYGALGGNIQVNMVDFVSNGIVSDPSVAAAIVDELTPYLFPEPLISERRTYFLDQILLGNLSQNNWYFEWLTYQNTGNSTSVKIKLNDLFKAVVYSREFQLM
ncbi:MAG TPA: DUF1800 family protein [Saprospiraceae bacterium]|nr:DUF1800 family protein [Saprospiraceae bacterium]